MNLPKNALKQLVAIIGSVYKYLLEEEYVLTNQIKMIKQKSKYIQKIQKKPRIRRLSELQWQYVTEVTKELAEQNPKLHECTLFILSALYLMHLRIPELAASKRWIRGLGSNGTANRLKVFLLFLMVLTHHVLPHLAWRKNIDRAY